MKTIIITGAAGGIGKETVAALSKADVELICIDVNQESLDRLIDSTESLPGNRIAITSSLEDQKACSQLFESITNPISGLIHLAGVFEKDLDFDSDTYNRAIQHNLTNGYTLAGLVSERMDKKIIGSIVFVSSLSYMRGARDYVAYSAAKGGLVGMTRALSRRLAPRIRVNAITPGIINTPMPAQLIAERGQYVAREIPLGRIGEPEEIASVIAFIMSSNASYITGQVINVDGGITNT